MSTDQRDVAGFWGAHSCGEELYLTSTDADGYNQQAAHRYALEPYIIGFADFPAARGKRVLEIGVGLGAEHERFAAAGADLFGIDLTQRAVDHNTRRLDAFGLRSTLTVGDAEALAFPDNHFDLVYSWGVLHHSTDTPRAIGEVRRVLKPGGLAKIMVYSKWSIIGAMLWTRYGLMRGRPFTSLSTIYARHLESPGTKAYSVKGARKLMSGFADVDIRTVLTHGDLLESGAGQRHRGALLDIARKVWPRPLIRAMLPTHGLYMLIQARKPS